MTIGISKVAHNRIDHTGKRFGRLLVVEYSHTRVTKSNKKNCMWKCKCDCGNYIVTASNNLSNGLTKSCGCFNKDMISQAKFKHGKCESGAYKTWTMMLHRCNNPKSTIYKDYGGRGITVFERWKKFENFYTDMGDRPDEFSIDRINVDGNYEPSNCRWVSHKEQCRNRRSSRIIEYDGRKMLLGEWASIIGVHRCTLSERLEKWPLDKAMTTPSRKLNTTRQELPTDPK